MVEYLMAKEQCSRSELLAMDNDGLKEMVDVHSKVVKERIEQHQVAAQQANQQCRDTLKVTEFFLHKAVIWKARSDKYKATIARERAGMATAAET